MNPQFDKQANLNLPPPVTESVTPSPESMPAMDTAAGEQMPPVAQGPSQPLPLPAAIPAATIPLPPPPAATQTASTTTTPVAADDNDLIEKEWVAKAKDIIAKTKENPYDQSRQISAVKADYMKKRYNKEIKLAQE